MKREFVVGVVLFVLVAVLLAMTLWIDDPGFASSGERSTLTARFDDVAGLRVGDRVRLRGAECGRVAEIRPAGDGVDVVMTIDFDPQLRDDAVVEIRSGSALGGAVVAIRPGTAGRPPLPPGVVRGVTQADAFDKFAALADELRGPLLEAVGNIRDVSADLEQRDVVRKLDDFATNLSAMSTDLREGKGTLGKLMSDESLWTDLESAVASLKKLGEDANAEGGALYVLVHDKQLATDLRDAVSNVRSVTEKLDRGDGSLARLLNDPALYDDLASTADNLKEISRAARDGEGALGKLLYDAELADRIDRVSKDVAQVTGKLRRGEGTFGRLLQDEELYEELRAAFKQISAGAGDARENAPILTFAAFLFGGF